MGDSEKPEVQRAEVQQIPIDPNGRCLLVVKGLSTAAFLPIKEQFVRWWQSGDPVLLVSVAPDVEVEFVRVNSEQEPSKENLQSIVAEFIMKCESLAFQNEFGVCEFCGAGREFPYQKFPKAWKAKAHQDFCIFARARKLIENEQESG